MKLPKTARWSGLKLSRVPGKNVGVVVSSHTQKPGTWDLQGFHYIESAIKTTLLQTPLSSSSESFDECLRRAVLAIACHIACGLVTFSCNRGSVNNVSQDLAQREKVAVAHIEAMAYNEQIPG
jgi:hypothetical protein